MKAFLNPRVIGGIIVGFVLAIITFPFYDLGIQPGIDPPLKWVFSHFASTGFENADYLNFPHGPLAFLMYPLVSTVGLTIIFTILLKILFVFLSLKLYKELCFMRWVHIILTAYLVFVLGSINHLIIANVLLSYLVFYRTRNVWFKFSALILTAIALYIKSYVGILTGLISVSFIFYMAFRYRKYLISLYDGITLLGLYYAIWIFIFGKFSGFFTYLKGIKLLAEDNSAAAAYYPSNNWYLLGVFLVIIFILPFVQRVQRAFFFGSITILSLFGAWKHGMAREDIFHVNGLFVYVAILYLVFLLFIKKKKIINVAAVTIALYCFSLNSERAYNYSEPEFNWWGVSNISHVFEPVDNKASIGFHNLPAEMKELIGNSTVDVYPWDYSIIAANDLNWKPRPILHSYAAYTPWLDKRDADHFNSIEAPEFIIWEKNKITSDLYRGQLESIDHRSLLNNEPQALLQLISNYECVSSTDKIILLQKRKSGLKATSSEIYSSDAAYNSWIKVPEFKQELLRLKLTTERSTDQKIKSFLYKDEQYWIHLKSTSGIIYKYRFVPKNAENGIWINPLIRRFIESPEEITHIRVIKSNYDKKEKIDITWEETRFNEKDAISSFFGLKHQERQTLLYSKRKYDKTEENWSNAMCIELGRFNNWEVLKTEYSSTFELKTDSLPIGAYQIFAQVQVRGETDEKMNLVLSHDESSAWRTFNLKSQVINEKDWNLVAGSGNLDLVQSSGTLKVYVHNPDNNEIHLDNFEVFLFRRHDD